MRLAMGKGTSFSQASPNATVNCTSLTKSTQPAKCAYKLPNIIVRTAARKTRCRKRHSREQTQKMSEVWPPSINFAMALDIHLHFDESGPSNARNRKSEHV